MEADKISEDDSDEEAIKPFMDPDNIQARIDHIQCVDIVPCSKGKEEVAVHEEKDGNWGGGITLPDPGVYGPGTSEERPPGMPTGTFGRGSTQTTGEAPEGKLEDLARCSPGHTTMRGV